MRSRLRSSLLLLACAPIAAGLFYLARFYRDRAWLADLARDVTAKAGAVTPSERALALRDYLRRTVTYHGAEHDDRPYLRSTARETIESGKGYCGESTRALLALAREVGVRGQRVNLYGDRLNHVVAELEFEPGKLVLVDAQDCPEFNAYFDARDRSLDEAIGASDAWFRDYSNINVRRVPVLGSFVQRVRTREGWLTDLMEEPSLLLFGAWTSVGVLGPLMVATDRLFMRLYARRMGLAVHTDLAAQDARAAALPGDDPRTPLAADRSLQ
jgi:hypothetical protein